MWMGGETKVRVKVVVNCLTEEKKTEKLWKSFSVSGFPEHRSFFSLFFLLYFLE